MPIEAAEYRKKAADLKAAMLKHMWFADEAMFYNVRRDTGKPVKRISYSNFVPLIDDILPDKDAKAMITRYMLNKDVMLAPYGIRSLSKQDPDYNNAAIIVPYSNWQGPIWINANYMNYICAEALRLRQGSGGAVGNPRTHGGRRHSEVGLDARRLRRRNRSRPGAHAGAVGEPRVLRIRGMESAGAGHAAMRGEEAVRVSEDVRQNKLNCKG